MFYRIKINKFSRKIFYTRGHEDQFETNILEYSKAGITQKRECCSWKSLVVRVEEVGQQT